MDDLHRQVLIKARPYLVQNLDVSPAFVAILVSQGILNGNDEDRLEKVNLPINVILGFNIIFANYVVW